MKTLHTLCLTTFFVLLLSARAGTFQVIHSFTGSDPDGKFPQAGLTLAPDGTMYGTTGQGGASAWGTIYKVSSNGVYANWVSPPIYNQFLSGQAVMMNDGNVYTTSKFGGDYGFGTVFRVTPGGAVSSIASFDGTTASGRAPTYAGLVQAADGTLYGTASLGGANGKGTVYGIRLDGTFTNVYSFTGGADGASPTWGLVSGADGKLYGVVNSNFFSFTTAGVLSVLGTPPGASGRLCQSFDATFMGVGANGGILAAGSVYRTSYDGGVVSISSFDGTNGSAPRGGLLLASDGNFYGTASQSGTNGLGTLFRLTPASVLTKLLDFGGTNGSIPVGDLVQAADGKLYGVCSSGGANGFGAVFSYDIGLLAGGALRYDNGNFIFALPVIVLPSDFLLGSQSNSTATLVVSNSTTLYITNGVLGIGNSGTLTNGSGSGVLTVDGDLYTTTMLLGSTVGGSGQAIIHGRLYGKCGQGFNDAIVDGGILDLDPSNPGQCTVGEIDAALQNRLVGGYLRDGSLFVTNNGIVTAPEIVMGLTNGTGQLVMSSGSVTALGAVTLGMSQSSTGLVTLIGGTLSATNGTMAVGPGGSGVMNISGGTLLVKQLQLGGSTDGASGIVNLSGGAIFVFGDGDCPVCGQGFNDFEQTGGTNNAANTSTTIGWRHNAKYDLFGGTAITRNLYVGYSSGFTGTFNQTNGVLTVTSNLVVGDCISNATGLATLSGGTLFVTNAAHNAVLDVQRGSFLMTGGSLTVDTLVVTNSCGGTFSHTGGTLSYSALIINPEGDADGDGYSNAAELAAGTDPLNANSHPFHILSATITNSDVRVVWETVGGQSYVVQTNGQIGGSSFADLSPVITIPGTNSGTTNYTHVGGATNGSRNFYRVRLGP